MAKASITINGDTRVLEKTSAVSNFLKSPRKLLSDIGSYLQDEFDKNFPAEGARLGKRWEKLAASTILQKARYGYGGKGILERTGKMRQAFKKDVSRSEVRVYNDVDYYRYHQLGTKKMPQRKMIHAPEKVKQEIVAMLAKEVRRKL